jgi:hypothetical protein
MKQENDFLDSEIRIREFDLILQKIYENSSAIAQKIDELQMDWDIRVRSLEGKYQELDSRMRYTRID